MEKPYIDEYGLEIEQESLTDDTEDAIFVLGEDGKAVAVDVPDDPEEVENDDADH